MVAQLLVRLVLAVPVDMVAVAAGSFTMGDTAGELDERPAHTVLLDGFAIDRDEVRLGDYRVCVAAKRCAAPRGQGGGDDEPVRWVSWRDAGAYCAFRGKRLPTEAEWERAARGPDGRVYPWGRDPDCRRGNFGNYQGEGRCPENPGAPVAVGRYPGGSSAEGARDLAGNVWEWVADWYDPRYYSGSPRRGPKGPSRPPAPPRRVLRGGACCSMFGLPRAANRLAFPPDYTDDDIGFRCARSLGPGESGAKAALTAPAPRASGRGTPASPTAGPGRGR